MKAKNTILLFTVIILTIFLISYVTEDSYAYWASNISAPNDQNTTEPIAVGDWAFYPNWDNNTSYLTGDVVIYNGTYYEAKKDNIGYEPTVSPGWSGRWTETTVQ